MLRLSFLKISGVVYSVELINKPLHNKNLYYFHYQKLSTTWLKLISSVLKFSFSTFKTFSCFYNVLILWVNSMKFMILSLTKKCSKLYSWQIKMNLILIPIQNCSKVFTMGSKHFWSLGSNITPCNVVLIIVCSIEIAKKVLQTYDNVFHVYLMRTRRLQKYAFFFMLAFWDNPHYPFWDAHGWAG